MPALRAVLIAMALIPNAGAQHAGPAPARSPAPPAASNPGLELLTTVEKIVPSETEDGEPRLALVPAGTVAPGDQLVYTISFTNVGAQRADGIRITQPIPPGVRYVAGTAVGPGSHVLYSVDGGATYGSASELSVRDAERPAADGDGATRPAEAADYTHLRWLLEAPLDARAKGYVRFRAVAVSRRTEPQP
jgi:uncharacterized repeat protein (TIGR01451 family)